MKFGGNPWNRVIYRGPIFFLFVTSSRTPHICHLLFPQLIPRDIRCLRTSHTPTSRFHLTVRPMLNAHLFGRYDSGFVRYFIKTKFLCSLSKLPNHAWTDHLRPTFSTTLLQTQADFQWIRECSGTYSSSGRGTWSDGTLFSLQCTSNGDASSRTGNRRSTLKALDLKWMSKLSSVWLVST